MEENSLKSELISAIMELTDNECAVVLDKFMEVFHASDAKEFKNANQISPRRT